MTRLALLTVALLTGCASMSNAPTVQTLNVQTVKDHKEVADAGCIIANGAGRWFVTTPGRVTINKSHDELTIECSKEDVGSGREVIGSRANMGMWGNAVFGGPVGYLVDRKSGAGYDYPQTVVVVLKAKESPQEEIAPIPQPEQSELRIAPPTAAAGSPAQTATPAIAPTAQSPVPASPVPIHEAAKQSSAQEIAPPQPRASAPQPPNIQAPAPVEQGQAYIGSAQPPAPSVQPAQAGQAATSEQPAWQTPSPQPETHYYQPY